MALVFAEVCLLFFTVFFILFCFVMKISVKESLSTLNSENAVFTELEDGTLSTKVKFDDDTFFIKNFTNELYVLFLLGGLTSLFFIGSVIGLAFHFFG